MVKKEIAHACLKEVENCHKTKFNIVMGKVGMDARIDKASQILGFNVKEVKVKNKIKYSLVSLEEKVVTES